MAVKSVEVAKKPAQTAIGQFAEKLEPLKRQMALALPKHLTADRMARLVMTCFSSNEQLQKCTFQSIAASVMTASQLGLEIGVQGQGYLIPYGTTATFIPGWKGLIELLHRAGRANAWTGAVYIGDGFDWQLGDSPYLKHKPCGEMDESKLTHVYAIGRTNGSDWPIIECWPVERIIAHRDKFNKVGQKHYSYQNFEMYARKVVLLQVLKYLPTSVELAAAIQVADDDSRPMAIDADFTVVTQEVELETETKPVPKKEAKTKPVVDKKSEYLMMIVESEDKKLLGELGDRIAGDSGLTEDEKNSLYARLNEREVELSWPR